MSTWAMATSEPPMAVSEPSATNAVRLRGDSCRIGISRSNTSAPQVTTTELRRIEAGFGPSIASSSQRCIGNWAHLPSGPAIRARPSRLPASGEICAPAAQL